IFLTSAAATLGICPHFCLSWIWRSPITLASQNLTAQGFTVNSFILSLSLSLSPPLFLSLSYPLAHTHTHTHANAHTHTCTHMHRHAQTRRHTHAHMHTHAQTHRITHTHRDTFCGWFSCAHQELPQSLNRFSFPFFF